MGVISDIRYVGYAVKDLSSEQKFYQDVWKLDEVKEENDLVYFAAKGSAELYQVRLRQSDENSIDIVALKADTRQDVDALFERVKKFGSKIIFAPKNLETLGGGYGFRFFIPDGLPFEISTDVETKEIEILERWDAVPERISHVVLHSPNHHDLVKYFVDVLGFKISDWLGDFMCFLRCNKWHHRLAVLPGPPCLDHVAYDMPTIDDMFRGIYRLKKNDTDVLWGPGRHTAGNNTFSYFQSPNGNVVEYTSELEQVDENWQPTTYKPSQLVMDQWSTGVGGPKTMPALHADPALFKSAKV
ncbi:MAG: oxidoreductase [Robiginitomaculum sp.]|nr:MAG: oxidoreductase [Robiginitomaculum sp.]